jgi:hypothetical protein
MNNDILFNCCTNNEEPAERAHFVSLEVSGCIDHDGSTEGLVPDDRAEFWTVYAREPDGCAYAITDCKTRALADEVARFLGKSWNLPVTRFLQGTD